MNTLDFLRSPGGGTGGPPAKRRRKSPIVVDLTRDDDDESVTRRATTTISTIATVAPMFRAVAERPPRRTLILLRHAVTQGYHLRDTPLSAEGARAARATRVFTAARPDVVVCSPLTRALQTLLLAHAGDAAAPALSVSWPLAGGGCGGAFVVDAAPPPLPPHGTAAGSGETPCVRTALPVLVTPLARERLSTRGDEGRPGPALAADAALGRLRGALLAAGRHLEDGWWLARHGPRAAAAGWAGSAVSDAAAGGGGAALADAAAGAAAACGGGTPSADRVAAAQDSPDHDAATAPAVAPVHVVPREAGVDFKRRVAALLALLRSLPPAYSRVLIVGHAVLFRELAGVDLGFCGFAEVRLAA